MNFRNKVSCFIYSALSVVWKVILHLPKILNHPLLFIHVKYTKQKRQTVSHNIWLF